jgi:hypothetical protein
MPAGPAPAGRPCPAAAPRRCYPMNMEVSSAAFGVGTLALINAGLAEQKGRSRLIWFLVSLITGPLATFLIVVLDRVDARRL